MSLRRPLVLALALASSTVGFAACVSSPDAPAPTVEELKRHRHGVVTAIVDTALERAALSEEQRVAIEAIRARADADHEARSALRARMRASASDVVRAGTTDSAAFDEAIDEATAALEERIAQSEAAIKELHGLLSPSQRVAVADGLRDRVEQRWGKAPRDRHEALGTLARDLVLTPEQVAGLEAIRDEVLGQSRRLRPTPEELYALIDAFEGEDFAAAVDAFHEEKAPLLRERIAEASEHADAALSLLENEQRLVLADIIEHGRDVLRPDDEPSR